MEDMLKLLNNLKFYHKIKNNKILVAFRKPMI